MLKNFLTVSPVPRTITSYSSFISNKPLGFWCGRAPWQGKEENGDPAGLSREGGAAQTASGDSGVGRGQAPVNHLLTTSFPKLARGLANISVWCL